MTNIPAPAKPESLATLHEQDARRHRLVLLTLVEHGMGLARLYVQQAKAELAAKPGAGLSPELAAAYDIVARSVRQSVMLMQKLTEPAAKQAAAAPLSAREELIRRVEAAINRDAPPDEAEELHAEFRERLDGGEFEDELDERPVQEIVDDVRADLGIRGPDSLLRFKRRTPEDIAVLHALAAAPAGTLRGSLLDTTDLVARLLKGMPPTRKP